MNGSILDRRRMLALAGLAAASFTRVTSSQAAATASPDTDMLIVVDVQNDFLPGGSLAVPQGDEVIDPINQMMKQFKHMIFTQDWHPADHISFAANHPGKKPFESIDLPYGKQVLWPIHCVEGSRGAAFSEKLDTNMAELILRKGFNRDVDGYSGFMEADRKTPTGLAVYLKERGIKRVFAAGLALDFCVSWTAVDASKSGFETFVVEDACRGINAGGSGEKAQENMRIAGVRKTTTRDLAKA